MNDLVERYLQCFYEHWKRFIEEDGISFMIPPDYFMETMDIEYNRNKVKMALATGIPIISNKEQGEFLNFFTFNDIAYGEICEKCKSCGGVILLQDENFAENLEEKFPVPSIELYYVLKIMPYTDDFIGLLPVPVNPATDYWYCPFCHELREFGYSKDIGMYYKQKPVKVR